jgi:hypothetical protein
MAFGLFLGMIIGLIILLLIRDFRRNVRLKNIDNRFKTYLENEQEKHKKENKAAS